MNTEQMRALADSHLDPGWTWRDAQLALREAADRIEALTGLVADLVFVADSDPINFGVLHREILVRARALLASESLNTGEPGNG